MSERDPSLMPIDRMGDMDPDELANAVRDAVAWAEVQEERFGRNCAAPIEDTEA